MSSTWGFLRHMCNLDDVRWPATREQPPCCLLRRTRRLKSRPGWGIFKGVAALRKTRSELICYSPCGRFGPDLCLNLTITVAQRTESVRCGRSYERSLRAIWFRVPQPNPSVAGSVLIGSKGKNQVPDISLLRWLPRSDDMKFALIRRLNP